MSELLNEADINEKLHDLIELDYDAIAAYKAAIDGIDDASYKAKLIEFMGDHERHVTEFSGVIRKQGGKPPDSGDFKQILTAGKVKIADMVGSDDSILKAMKANEEQTNSKYESMVQESFPAPVQKLLEAGLADEKRHRAWINSALNK